MSGATYFSGRSLQPIEAYEALESWTQEHGRKPLLLLMHGAVPNSLRPDLLNIIKLNFVPEARGDPSVDADVLFSPFMEALGSGFYQLHPEIRRQSLDLLDGAFKHEPIRRSVRVARLVLAYIDRLAHDTERSNPLVRRFTEIERWVALAFTEPAEAAQRFAEALKRSTESPEVVARLRFGGLAAAVGVPLAGHQELLAYAEALDQIAEGDIARAQRLLAPLGSAKPQHAGVQLPAASELLSFTKVADGLAVGEQTTPESEDQLRGQSIRVVCWCAREDFDRVQRLLNDITVMQPIEWFVSDQWQETFEMAIDSGSPFLNCFSRASAVPTQTLMARVMIAKKEFVLRPYKAQRLILIRLDEDPNWPTILPAPQVVDMFPDWANAIERLVEILREFTLPPTQRSKRLPDAFLSYTRFDDRRGDISAFREHLQDAIRDVTGEPFEIFQDVEGIGIGEHWLDKLDPMLDEVRFFIPILTPSYFTSRACREELEKFLRAKADRGRDDLVLPIYYIECHVLEQDYLRAKDPLATKVHELQLYDWRELRYNSFSTKAAQEELKRLARDMARLRRRTPRPILPPHGPVQGSTAASASLKSEAAGSKRWKVFLTYADDDNDLYIKDFYEVFTREMGRLRIGAQEEFRLDASQKAFGDVGLYLDSLASQADFLIIFVGMHYPSRAFCLREWFAFRNQFIDRNEARERLFVIELDKGALEVLKHTLVEGREDVSRERVNDLAACFYQQFWRDDGRIISRTDNGILYEDFEQKVEHVAEVFANRYHELVLSPKAPAVDPEWIGVNDVLIGPWTDDLWEDVKDLYWALRSAGKSCAYLPSWTDVEEADQVLLEKMRVVVSAVEHFVQPYSIVRVELLPGRRAHFDFFNDCRVSRPVRYWRPLSHGTGSGPGTNATHEIESRWGGTKEWVGTRLKEIERNALVGSTNEVLPLLLSDFESTGLNNDLP